MADPRQLSKRERQIMDVIFARGEATVSQVIEGIPDAPMRGALRTLLRILERKGYVTHRKRSRAFTFEPVIGHSVARKSALTQLLTRFFEGSPAMLVLDLFGHDAMDAGELTRLRALIDGPAPLAKNSRKKTTRRRRP